MPADVVDVDQVCGFTLLECLVAVALLGVLASLSMPSTMATKPRLILETSLRRVQVGLDRGRIAARRDRQPCALQLGLSGWQAPLHGQLPPCRLATTTLHELGVEELQLRSNLPDAVRFSSNGLVLDGGLVMLSHPSDTQVLCLVIGLPLGISRTGVYRGDPGGVLNSALCHPNDV